LIKPESKTEKKQSRECVKTTVKEKQRRFRVAEIATAAMAWALLA